MTTSSSLDCENNIRPKVCVVFATSGRPRILAIALDAIEAQTFKPDLTIVSCVNRGDVEELEKRDDLLIVTGPAGLPRQRNTALDHTPADVDFVAFMDDDFIAHPRWLEEALHAFSQDAAITGVTGTVIADGINGPGYSGGEALQLLSKATLDPAPPLNVAPYSPYGCNMAFRMNAIRGLRFDERLVLYGWQEDRDFGSQVARRGGRLVKIGRALGVHLGVKSGRVPGLRLGYSQVINPFYLWRKGTMTTRDALRHVLGNILANAVRSLHAEPYVDRVGRLRGNIIGIVDLARGKLNPERAAQL
jgi:GT2 family glycosyltransferase